MVSAAAIRLLTAVGWTYGIGLLSRFLFLYPTSKAATADATSPKTQTLQHLFHALSGWALGYLFMGPDLWRSVATVAVTWLFLQCCPTSWYRRGLAPAIVFAGTMGFLLYAYYHHATLDYDLDWTTPQSVLTLRLIALAFDIADGTHSPAFGTQPNALPDVPGLIPTLGFTFFPTAFFVGPQTSFRHYNHFVHGFAQEDAVKHAAKGPKREKAQASIKEGWRYRTVMLVAAAAFYFGLVHLGTTYAPLTLLETAWFRQLPLGWRILIGPFLGRLLIARYISIWLFVEAPSVLYGIAFSPSAASSSKFQGQERWVAMQNLDAWRLDTALSLKTCITAFNISTNNWSKQYVFKRMRWVGNKYVSQIATLFFLAIWHGFHAGYFVTFALEFLYVLAEGCYEQWLTEGGLLDHKLVIGLRWLLTHWLLGSPIIGFEYKTWSKTISLWQEQAFAPLWVVGAIFAFHLFWRIGKPPAPPPALKKKTF